MPADADFGLLISQRVPESSYKVIFPLFPPPSSSRFLNFKALFTLEEREAAGSQAARAQGSRECLFGASYGWE